MLHVSLVQGKHYGLQFFICGAVLIAGQCRVPLKIEARSTGLLDRYAPTTTSVGGQTWSYGGILVQHGHPVELYCTGERIKELSLFLIGNVDDDMLYYIAIALNIKQINETTAVYFMSNPERQFNLYTCGYGKSLIHNETAELALALVVDSVPAPNDFMCVWALGRGTIITCKWNCPNVHGEYKLSFMKERTIQGTCEMNILKNNSCTWALLEYPGVHNYTFQLNANNGFGYVNKTYNMSSLSILRLRPPVSLAVSSKGSHYALLQWSPNAPWEVLASSNLLHNVEYSMQGMKFQRVNSTPQMISWNKYRLEVNLPCPGKIYEARVSVKITETDDRYWSDYSTISLYTDPEENGAVDTDPACQTPDIELNGPVMKYKVQNLRKEVRDGLVKLMDKLMPLRKKTISIRSEL